MTPACFTVATNNQTLRFPTMEEAMDAAARLAPVQREPRSPRWAVVVVYRELGPNHFNMVASFKRSGEVYRVI